MQRKLIDRNDCQVHFDVVTLAKNGTFRVQPVGERVLTEKRQQYKVHDHGEDTM